MGAFKAPGPDGVMPLFYQQFWGEVGTSVISFVQQAFKDGQFDPTINETLITLIPKVESPEHITQFRPISLCNVVVKVITKVIANRLKTVMSKLARPEQ